ncbi:hypothetical protein A8139_06430 [Marinomonas primoryensis]|uniref:Uncharacterized protein n=1 Tax=Marinomonas primoryensis TaxID=178399 RepID=A0A2Z4PQE4_9GAMM|nr:hypothetical protein [Marinomonas primoryensis]AWX99674.1 hypothetical protein A8139_06430 [Marinomonas primoryensis]
MDYSSIFEYFLDSDFDIQPSSHFDLDTLSVYVRIEGRMLTLVHFCVNELRSLPQFYLKNSTSLGVLAHVINSDYEGFKYICVNQLDSVSVNFERPELAFEESIKRHIELLTPLIKDTEFNKIELLREFKTNWNINTKSLRNNSPKTDPVTDSV